MAKKIEKLLSLILAVSMIMSLLTVGVSATEDGESETLPANVEQIEYAGGSATNGDGVTVSKTIEGTDDENVFDITLKVDTQKSITEVYRKAQSTAVVIVMDVSHTMKEQFGNTNRYEAAVAAASSFMENYANIENPAGADRKIGFVAFNTDAHEIFAMSDCKTADQAEDLIKLMDNKADTLIGADDFCGGHDGYCADSEVSKCAFYSEHSRASSAIYSARFTNIEAGLKMGADMLKASGAVNQYIVFLSDGFPTTYLIKGRDDYAGYNPYCSSGTIGKDGVFYDQKTGRYCDYGTSYSDKGAERAQTMAAAIKATGAKIYSIGVNVEGQSIQGYVDRGEGKTFSVVDCYGSNKDYVIGDFKAWLKNSIGSGYYWDSTNTSQMNAAFTAILQEIKDSVVTNSQASWVASDPMNALNTTAIDFLQFYNKDGELVSGNLTGPAASENTASFANDSISWDLKNSGYQSVNLGNNKNFMCALKYRVRLMNEESGFVEKAIYDTNDVTSLTYRIIEVVNDETRISDQEKIYFPIPKVFGYLSELNFNKVDVFGNPLAGAKFALTHDTANCGTCRGDGEGHVTLPVYEAVSGTDGIVSFVNIPSGHSYLLTETQPPEGYSIVHNNFYHVTVSYDTLTVTVTDTDGNPLEWTGSIENVIYYTLPNTGGAGTSFHTLGGLLIILASTCGYVVYTGRKRQKGGDRA